MLEERELRRVAATLGRLLGHARGRGPALTGGVAIDLHLRAAGIESARARADDVDLVADDVGGFGAGIRRDFLISHYHLPGPGRKRALLQLVDPAMRLRVDIFPDVERAIAKALPREVAGVPCTVLDARSILEHKRALLAKAAPDGPVDEKHWHDAVSLSVLCGVLPPARPAYFAPARFETKLGAVCARCERSWDERFPLAPKQRIMDVLGYV